MSVVQSEGQVESLVPAWAPTPGGTNGQIGLIENRFADYGAIWRTQPAVRTVVGFRARNIAQLGVHVFRRVNDTDRQRVTDHGLARTLSKPNPWTTPYRLKYALFSDLAIYDAALWVKFRRDDGEIAVVRIPPPRFTPIGGSWIHPEGFRITGGRGSIVVPLEGCVYFSGYSPEAAYGGCSPMESLRQTIAEEFAASEYRSAMWRNGARAEHVITRPAEAPVMSPEAKDRFWARWNAQYVGTANAAKTALLEEGMDIKAMSYSAKDAQYIEARKFNLEEVARFYHVLPQSIGIMDNANYSNMESAHKQLYQDALGPDIESAQQEIELQLAPEYPDSASLYVEFNIADKMKGSFREQAASIQTFVGAPVLTRNEGRSLLNRPPVEGGDELITPMNVTTGGQASATDSAPDPSGDDPNSPPAIER